jgi:nicotinic acid mononucleotide adenylyltransferase
MQRNPKACSTVELPMTLQPISSTAVRAQRQAGADVTALVGAAVARYIDEHRLYTGTP